MNEKEALTIMFLDAKFAKFPLPNLLEMKWKTEPGITMEMIRHFEHDIMGKAVYTDLESYMKAAKYMTRSDEAVEKAGGEISNKLLSDFAKKLTENKQSHTTTQSAIIKEYYQKIESIKYR